MSIGLEACNFLKLKSVHLFVLIRLDNFKFQLDISGKSVLAKIFSLFLSGQIKMCLECGIVQRIFCLRNITKRGKGKKINLGNTRSDTGCFFYSGPYTR